MPDIDTNSIYTQLGLNPPAENGTKENDELGQAEFLALMTAQLQYQDPLKPMENGNFLGQMAQTYRSPIYGYFRRRGYGEDAADEFAPELLDGGDEEVVTQANDP